MAYSAKITNVLTEGNGFRVFFSLTSDTGEESKDESLSYDVQTPKDKVIASIKSRVDELNAAIVKTDDLHKDLINLVIT